MHQFNDFNLPTDLNTKEKVKAAYLELARTDIQWDQYGVNLVGFVNNAAIFQITLEDNMELVIETWYPGQQRKFGHGVETVEAAKALAEGFYKNWLKKDFRNLLDEMGE